MGETQRYGPAFVLRAKDWVVSLALAGAAFVVPITVTIMLASRVSGDLLVVSSLGASGLGGLAVFGLYLVFTNRTLDYVDFPGRSARAAAIGVLVGLALAAIQYGLTALFATFGVGGTVGPIGRLVRQRGITFLAAVTLANVLLVAPGEELLYRNGVQKLLSRSNSEAVAVVGAAAIFAFPHLAGVLSATTAEMGTVFFEVFVNAVGYGLAYAYWGRVDITIAAHAVYNCIVFGFAYLGVIG